MWTRWTTNLTIPWSARSSAKCLSGVLASRSGYVLPLKRAERKSGPEWQSCLWMLRSEHLYLIPGDSPVGLRLPLETLIWEPAEEKQKILEVDPTAPTGPLPVPVRRVQMAQPSVEFVEQKFAEEPTPTSRARQARPTDRRRRQPPHPRRSRIRWSARRSQWNRAAAGCTFSFLRWSR